MRAKSKVLSQTELEDIEESHFIQVVEMNPIVEVDQRTATEQQDQEQLDHPSSHKVELASGYITVFVQELDRKTLCFRLPKTTTIRDIKHIVCDRCDIPASRQRLRFSGKKIQDDQTLVGASIEDGNTVLLAERPSTNDFLGIYAQV